MKINESEKRDKYVDLTRELRNLWKMGVMTKQIIVGALRTIPKQFHFAKYLIMENSNWFKEFQLKIVLVSNFTYFYSLRITINTRILLDFEDLIYRQKWLRLLLYNSMWLKIKYNKKNWEQTLVSKINFIKLFFNHKSNVDIYANIYASYSIYSFPWWMNILVFIR